MERKKLYSYLFLLCWLVPLVLLPFSWVNAVVQDAEVLGTIHGTGFVVLSNFPFLIFSYITLSSALLVSKVFPSAPNIKLFFLIFLVGFAVTVLLLPRMIIGPTGLSTSGLRDGAAYEEMYLITIKPIFYLVIASIQASVWFYFLANVYQRANK
ncbi:MAG: hypothetical protein ACK5NA_07410 [Enterococcus sp.]